MYIIILELLYILILTFIDAENLLPKNNDLYSRLYALKKLLSAEDAKFMRKDLVKLIKKSSVDVDTLKILPEQWEILYDEISEF